jgi:UDP-glucose 4-epimerase
MASLTGDPMLVARGYDPPYQLVHEDDVAQAIHLAIHQHAPGVYNVAGDDPQTLRQLATTHSARVRALPFWLVRRLMALRWWLGLSPLGAELVDLARYPLVLDTDRLKALGWQPR